MKITLPIVQRIGSVIAFAIAYSISIGAAQDVITFNGAANEVGTMLISFMLGAALLIASFEKSKN